MRSTTQNALLRLNKSSLQGRSKSNFDYVKSIRTRVVLCLDPVASFGVKIQIFAEPEVYIVFFLVFTSFTRVTLVTLNLE